MNFVRKSRLKAIALPLSAAAVLLMPAMTLADAAAAAVDPALEMEIKYIDKLSTQGYVDFADEVIEAAKKAEIYEDILAMPKGFDTYVGERGTLLSGGQKQRVAIARIFLKNPPILILDEATSALDSVTEAKIQRAFDALAVGRTTLIIAHRLSTIRAASRIISIADGLITESGTHDELVNTNGIYANLYNTQNANNWR
jgi:ABC-type multidrug transport system fused ATPase/permease subunit